MERASLEADVIIVGAGPAGLATAIQLKKNAPEHSVLVVDKGSEVGAHIISGAVIDPSGLDALLPEWREDPACPLTTQVSSESFCWLTSKRSWSIPPWLLPASLHNRGNFVGSLGNLTKYLAKKAESLGVDIYPCVAGAEVLYDDSGAVIGIQTGDMGVSKDGSPKSTFMPGMQLLGKYTLFAEGARGHLTKRLMARFKLDANSQPQMYGIGLKELWRVRPESFRPGYIQHTLGWPLDGKTAGGSFLYHFGEYHVSVGFVVHLTYTNPTLSPFDEFQRFKNHPSLKALFQGGERLSYGARAISSGGWQSVPTLAFPGGALVGCAAGFVNVPRIKGTHNAIFSGILCADHVHQALKNGRRRDTLTTYEEAWRHSPIGQDLWPVRNLKPLWSRWGTVLGVGLGGIDLWWQRWKLPSLFGTVGYKKADYATLELIKNVQKRDYPPPDGLVSFDKPSSLFLSNTAHEEDQPCHLILGDPNIPIRDNLPRYGEPAQLYCPAGVYEVVESQGNPHFIINPTNCLHCKVCDIKDPAQNITWIPPEAGGGPNYQDM
jgi:electron-transferring-flavoprotein dehydrogenase